MSKMGWSIDLSDDSGIVKVPVHNEGSTLTVGGNVDASINLTWNYSKFYYDVVDKKKGLKWISGKKAKNTISRLTKAVKALGVDFSGDYWIATPGNAGKALATLLSWAKIHPEAIWEVS